MKFAQAVTSKPVPTCSISKARNWSTRSTTASRTPDVAMLSCRVATFWYAGTRRGCRAKLSVMLPAPGL